MAYLWRGTYVICLWQFAETCCMDPEHAALKCPIEQALDGHLFDFNLTVIDS